MVFWILILSLKTRIAIPTTKIGVNELRMLTNELSIFYSDSRCEQNAGNRFPISLKESHKDFFERKFCKMKDSKGKKHNPCCENP